MSYPIESQSGGSGFWLCSIHGTRVGPFADLRGVVAHLNVHMGRTSSRENLVGRAFRVEGRYPFPDRVCTYVVRDAWDLPIDPKRLDAEWTRLHDAWLRTWYRRRSWAAPFMPVPGTGKRSHGSIFRHPTNHALRRVSCDDQLPLVRLRIRHPVSSYDDIVRAKPQKSWKSTRRTQWRSAS